MGPRILLLSVVVAMADATTFLWTPEGNWQRPSSHSGTPVCVDIPVNMSLCHGIGYTKMRLPNLLHHDSLQEVSQQAVSWVPLSNLGCHPDTQLFLCSLFTPVCLDHPIPPCRSLCTAVQTSCESTMRKYGYPWPSIVRCDQFPVDNDMCIMAQHGQGGVIGGRPEKKQPPRLQPHQPSLVTVPKGNPTQDVGVKGEKRRKNKNRQNKNKRGHRQRGQKASTIDEDLATSTRKPAHHHLQALPLPSLSLQEHQSVNRPQAVVYSSRDVERNKKVARSEPNQSPDQPRGQGDERHKLHNLILSKFCGSQWSLKARATVTRSHDGQMHLKLRNYRVLHGSFRENLKNAEVVVARNLSSELDANLGPGGDSRQRYYLMGESKGKINTATLAIPWPHKMGQFRKALKLIKGGTVNCAAMSSAVTSGQQTPAAAATEPTMVAVVTVLSSSPEPGSKDERMALRTEKRRRRKEERERRQRQRGQDAAEADEDGDE